MRSVGPDVALVDVHLPDMDGFTLLKSVRAVGARIPAALFTADLDVLERASEAHELGAILVSKLCDLDQVMDLVLYL